MNSTFKIFLLWIEVQEIKQKIKLVLLFLSECFIILEIRCKVPSKFHHGSFNLAKDQSSRSSSSGSSTEGSSKIGGRLKFSCDKGFNIDGLEELECLEDGSWSDLPPICQPDPCSHPPM